MRRCGSLLYLYCDERREILWKIALAQRKSRGQSPRDLLRDQANNHRLSQLESQYRHSQLQLQYCASWESNIGRVDSLYCSGSWGYIFQYTPSSSVSSTGSIFSSTLPVELDRYGKILPSWMSNTQLYNV